ncbi:hypothetical protein [Paracoccus homiensis]|uniref:hypothetical protein n=1 Tax=Paracoccus homiensis TaxID=364199 RepID=UPI000B80B198|nr:hypothetical protein [Paracoccus homiensis]
MVTPLPANALLSMVDMGGLAAMVAAGHRKPISRLMTKAGLDPAFFISTGCRDVGGLLSFIW